MQEMETYTISGLKTITCYGSSIVFESHMYDMEGVYGVATYLKDQRAKIWYDSEYADTIGIREWIFSPAIIPIHDIPDTLGASQKSDTTEWQRQENHIHLKHPEY